MNDLISRSALKTEIHKAILEIADTPARNDYASKLALKIGELVMKKIDDAPAADAVPQWVSVEDELPPVGERVLACPGGRVVYEAYLDCTDKWCRPYGNNGFVFEVTHWMPLPEPPEEVHPSV